MQVASGSNPHHHLPSQSHAGLPTIPSSQFLPPAIHLALGQVPHPLSPHEHHVRFAPGRRPHQRKPRSTAATASGSGQPQRPRRPDSPAGSSRRRAAGKARPTSDTSDLLRRPSLAWRRHWPEGQEDDER